MLKFATTNKGIVCKRKESTLGMAATAVSHRQETVDECLTFLHNPDARVINDLLGLISTVSYCRVIFPCLRA